MQPSFKIVAEGRDITALLRDRLVSIQATDKTGMDSDEVTITIDDRDGAVALPRRGAYLDVSLGYVETGLTRIGRYRIDEVESIGPPQKIVMHGRPADMSGSLKSARRHSWEGVDLATVVRQIAARNKLTPVCNVKARIDRVDQMNESDLHFITRLARQYDATASVKGGKLLVLARGGQTKSASGKKLPTIVLKRSDIDTWHWTASDREEAGGVKVKHHNKKTGKTLVTLVPDKDNPTAPVKALRHPASSPGRAAARAKGALNRANRSTVKMSIELPGRADLVAERVVSLSGIKAGVDGPYPIESVVHDYTQSGWKTSCELGASKQARKNARGQKKKKSAKPLKVLTPN